MSDWVHNGLAERKLSSSAPQKDNMFASMSILTSGLIFANVLQLGNSLQLPQKDIAYFNQVAKNLPLAECDTIVVSSSPFEGERFFQTAT